MKKKVLLLALLPILLAAYLFSCQNSADGTDELLSIDAKNLISPPENGGIGLRSGSGFEDSIDILYLGTIDIISDTTLRTAIKNKALIDSIDGEVGFDYIQSIATANSINLISLMQSSITNHGGTSTQASQLPGILDGFDYGGNNYMPMIYFPVANQSQSATSTVLAKGSISEPSGTYYGVRYTPGTTPTTVAISLSVAQSNYLWAVTADSGDDPVWKFWRRCWCVQDENPDGSPSNNAQCAGTKNNLDDWKVVCGVCEISDFHGNCSNDWCNPCQ